MLFKALQLSEPVVRAVQALGYAAPTPIQAQAVPVVLSGRDLIGSAQTGTGKTAAFALPVLTRLARHGRCRCLVLEPTRELAAQVDAAFRDFGRFTDLRSVVVHGGVGYGNQRAALRQGVDIVVATPGRLMDFLREGALSLRDLQVLVLDEVDRMLDMGFLPVVKDIIGRCPRERQTLFFSATVPPQIQAIAAFALRDPVRVAAGQNQSVNTAVTHALYPVAAPQKFDLLLALLQATTFRSVLIFTRTKHGADKIARRLKAGGHTVGVLHGNRSQNQRTEALAGFKSGKYELMVATDIAARGIDVAGVSHVINFDVPENPEDYVHRIGRTGRAQSVGDAFTLATPENRDDVRAIERLIKQTIPRRELAGFDYAPIVAQPPKPPPAGRGHPARHHRQSAPHPQGGAPAHPAQPKRRAFFSRGRH